MALPSRQSSSPRGGGCEGTRPRGMVQRDAGMSMLCHRAAQVLLETMARKLPVGSPPAHAALPCVLGQGTRSPLDGVVYRLGQRRKTQQQSNQPNLLSAVALMPRDCRARLERIEDANPGLPRSRAEGLGRNGRTCMWLFIWGHVHVFIYLRTPGRSQALQPKPLSLHCGAAAGGTRQPRVLPTQVLPRVPSASPRCPTLGLASAW